MPPPAPQPDAKRIRVRIEDQRIVIARVHGTGPDGESSILLPDGQLRSVTGDLAETDEPFVPATADAMEHALLAGEYKGFHLIKSAHYLIFYQSSQRFAEASGKLLENLYKGLTEALRKQDIATHEAEFPLVAVIYRTEKDFRANKPVAPAVQACYEILTNRIFLYETSESDKNAPELSALQRPQMVAHEGTHQILSNIGVQPRLGAWPIWLIEGLAEYCSPPAVVRRGGREVITWRGLGVVNPFHMATISDLEDPESIQAAGIQGPRIERERGTPLVEYLVTREDLNPTDYALAWALTHYLAKDRTPAFVNYLKALTQLPPLTKRNPADQLAAFRDAFGQDLVKLDKAVAKHLAKQRYEPLPYYAVVFEQPIGRNRVRRGAMVSRSPSVIQQWVERSITPDGGVPSWEAYPHQTKASAVIAVKQWLGNR